MNSHCVWPFMIYSLRAIQVCGHGCSFTTSKWSYTMVKLFFSTVATLSRTKDV